LSNGKIYPVFSNISYFDSKIVILEILVAKNVLIFVVYSYVNVRLHYYVIFGWGGSATKSLAYIEKLIIFKMFITM